MSSTELQTAHSEAAQLNELAQFDLYLNDVVSSTAYIEGASEADLEAIDRNYSRVSQVVRMLDKETPIEMRIRAASRDPLAEKAFMHTSVKPEDTDRLRAAADSALQRISEIRDQKPASNPFGSILVKEKEPVDNPFGELTSDLMTSDDRVFHASQLRPFDEGEVQQYEQALEKAQHGNTGELRSLIVALAASASMVGLAVASHASPPNHDQQRAVPAQSVEANDPYMTPNQPQESYSPTDVRPIVHGEVIGAELFDPVPDMPTDVQPVSPSPGTINYHPDSVPIAHPATGSTSLGEIHHDLAPPKTDGQKPSVEEHHLASHHSPEAEHHKASSTSEDHHHIGDHHDDDHHAKEDIPETVTVQPGQTIDSIAKGLHIPPEEVIKRNPGLNPNIIVPGQRLNISEKAYKVAEQAESANAATAETLRSPEAADQLPPTVENYCISILKLLAQKQGIPESMSVTQAHINALMAWAYLEEGDLRNNGHYNLFNTGIDNTSLLATANSADGTQAFISFNAGVEGTVETMLKPEQNRFAITLSNPNLTEEQLFSDWTYYQKYQGNDYWAQADSNAVIDGVQYTQAGYLEDLQTRLAQVMGDYGWHARVMLGMGSGGYLDSPQLAPESSQQFTGSGPVTPPAPTQTTSPSNKPPTSTTETTSPSSTTTHNTDPTTGTDNKQQGTAESGEQASKTNSSTTTEPQSTNASAPQPEANNILIDPLLPLENTNNASPQAGG